MATYNNNQGHQSILNAALGEYQDKGFQLREPDDHCLYIYYRGEFIGVISQGVATIPVIHEACRLHLESISAS